MSVFQVSRIRILLSRPSGLTYFCPTPYARISLPQRGAGLEKVGEIGPNPNLYVNDRHSCGPGMRYHSRRWTDGGTNTGQIDAGAVEEAALYTEVVLHIHYHHSRLRKR